MITWIKSALIGAGIGIFITGSYMLAVRRHLNWKDFVAIFFLALLMNIVVAFWRTR